MSKINRRYIDKHWLVFVIRGVLAGVFGLLILFNNPLSLDALLVPVGIYLLAMGAIDAVNAIYNSHKKRGWGNWLVDAVIDVVAAAALLFAARDNLLNCVVVISVYTLISGIVDIFHGFLSTVDPTDRFIRVLVGACGCIIGLVILNAGEFELLTFLRFFGVYTLIVGVTSLIYGVHNHAQGMEDHTARQESAKEAAKEAEQETAKTAKSLHTKRRIKSKTPEK